MDIILIGNGFDIAHGLPTTYGDFLKFMKAIKEFGAYEGSCFTFEKYGLNDKIKLLLEEKINQKEKTDRELKLLKCAESNFWTNYFLQHENFKKENWVDFENEISKVVQILDEQCKNVHENIVIPSLEQPLSNCLQDYCPDIHVPCDEYGHGFVFSNKYKINQLPNVLKKHLDNLIEALEIYLTDYVDTLIDEHYIAPDIKNICNDIKIISFNYTYTYSIVYDKSNETPIHHIHGSIRKNKEVRSNNMVLGIDEYLSNDEKDTNLNFIEFKKYFQRIFKGTGAEYKAWLKLLENPCTYNDITKRPNLYIFGHSLDVSDKDILKELICDSPLHTTIFYHNEKSRAEKIINLVKVIGQDKLIEFTGNGRIKFVKQKDMVLLSRENQ